MARNTDFAKSVASALALLFVGVAGGMCAESQRRYVNGEVRKFGSGSYDIIDHATGVNLYANGFGYGMSFSGRPFSGTVSGSGSFYHISGGGVSANVSAWGGNYTVNATAYPTGGGQPLRISFNMYAIGRTDDPANPPSYNVYDHSSGASLYLSPLFGLEGYRMSGWVEMDKFGSYGIALVGLVAAIAIDARPVPRPRPKAEGAAPPAGQKLAALPFPL